MLFLHVTDLLCVLFGKEFGKYHVNVAFPFLEFAQRENELKRRSKVSKIASSFCCFFFCVAGLFRVLFGEESVWEILRKRGVSIPGISTTRRRIETLTKSF